MTAAKLEKAISRWRVRAALIFIPFVVLLSEPTRGSMPVGIAVCLFGLGIRAWASGHLKKEKELTTSGPYRYCRNPLYLGNLILGFGIALASRSWWVLIIFVAYFLVFYPPVIKKERNRLGELFPGQYLEYKKRVPLFFPTGRHAPAGGNAKFSPALYRRNREYRALVGTLIFWLILAAKILIAGR